MSAEQTPAPSRDRSKLAVVLIVLGVGLAVLAGYVAIRQHSVKPQAPTNASASLSTPSSKKPSTQAIANYSVPAANPKYIAIPAIGVDQTRIMQRGLLASGSIAVPDNIFDAGWYNGSGKPGKTGAMFVYGHVSSWTTHGVFYNLKKLKTGDKITITGGDNQTFTYTVATTKIYPYDHVDMRTVLSPIDTSKPGLNLMTCTGRIIKGTSEFDERLVIFASLSS